MSRSEIKTTFGAQPIARRRPKSETTDRSAHVARMEMDIARLERALLEQTIHAVTEREALAREVHDKFGQYLTVMELELAALGKHGDLTSGLRDRLQKLRGMTAEAHHEMANLAWQIRPVSLQGLDLENACRLLAAEWSERSDLLFDLHLSLSSVKLPPAVETTLYRVLQEALTNVAKHASATRVGIILRASAGEVVLVVEDDGSGFVPGQEDAPSLSLGLRGARERLALVGGTLEIETSPGRGTAVLVSIPL